MRSNCGTDQNEFFFVRYICGDINLFLVQNEFSKKISIQADQERGNNVMINKAKVGPR